MPMWGTDENRYNFHNDESLHDQTAGPQPFNLIKDTRPAIRLALAQKFDKGKVATVVKEELPHLDINDWLSKKATKGMVSMLWGSMLHPPLSYRGPQYQYRSVDGTNNNILYPNLGRAGQPYAKSVQTVRAFQGARPDPGDIFDLLMARNKAEESHVGISSLLLYQATLVIHDIFRTDDDDANISKTSSYLDLAPLYGSNQAELDAVRLFSDGLLKLDTFAEERLVNQPPGVCIFIIMYNRFHNYVAQQLLEINENGKFSLPPGYQAIKDLAPEKREAALYAISPDAPEVFAEALKKQDEDLFQTARLVTCGMYAQIAIHDYLRCLMRMHEKDTAWTLDPRQSYPEENNYKGLQRGEGNMVSAEFNLLYRFHSPLSERDRVWSEEAIEILLNYASQKKDKTTYIVSDNETVSEEEIRKGTKITKSRYLQGDVPVEKFRSSFEVLKKLDGTEEEKWKKKKKMTCFPEGLDRVGAQARQFRFQRDPKTNKFDDAQLAAEMARTIEDPICHFGAQHIPKVFKQIEILGMLHARKWEMASLNEFREFFGMSRHKKFEDINKDPKIAAALRDIYEDPDCVELYPGVYCEGDGKNLEPDEPMPNGVSAALWRGVFSDAVTLVRSDRFYTIDWNVQSLTAWGMNEVISNPKVNKGSLFHKLFARALPGYFKYNSLHMWQPFFTPTMNAILAQEQGHLQGLDLSGLEWSKKKADGWSVEYAGKFDRSKVRNFRTTCGLKPGKKSAPTLMLRRTLDPMPGRDLAWRGGEIARLAADHIVVSSYKDIKDTIVKDPSNPIWINPSYLDAVDIPYGPLRDVLTSKWRPWQKVTKVVYEVLKRQGHDEDKNDKFLAYFTGLAKDITRRERRSMQYVPGYAPWQATRQSLLKELPKKFLNKNGDPVSEDILKVKQIDVVKDYSIPIVTRFVADLLGFWDRVKTDNNDAARGREFNENQIYQHIQNCQNIESFDADPTKVWERRFAFKESLKKLQELTEYQCCTYRYSEPFDMPNLFTISNIRYNIDITPPCMP